jgi:protein-S-isoprenylcysteine O-methyltransferase Ste14
MREWRLHALHAAIRIAGDGPLLWMFYFLHFSKSGLGNAQDALFNIGLFLGFALVHSLLARPLARRGMERLVGEAWVRPSYVVLAGSSLCVVLAFWRPLKGELWRAEGVAHWTLLALFAAALAGLVYTAGRIDYPDFLGIPGLYRASRGAPERPPRFVASGPYAHCRHPMYVALLAVLWVGPVMTATRFEFAALATLYLFLGTILEERNLREELGEAYDTYRANVPMWFPRLRPWKHEG